MYLLSLLSLLLYIIIILFIFLFFFIFIFILFFLGGAHTPIVTYTKFDILVKSHSHGLYTVNNDKWPHGHCVEIFDCCISKEGDD